VNKLFEVITNKAPQSSSEILNGALNSPKCEN